MTVTPEQRTYARLAGIVILAHVLLEGIGDSVTIIARGSDSFAETARFAAGHMVLWRFCLLNVGLSWVSIGIFAHFLYVVLEPVDKRLAQLALVLRLGACFVGAGYVLFFLLFLRSRYLPRALAGLGIFTSAVLAVVAVLVFVFPERTNELKLCLVPALLTEIAAALWLVTEGLRPRATVEARG